jgi:hypothetical protein
VAGNGGCAISVSWKGLTATGSLARRLSSRPRLSFVARLLDAGKRTTTLQVRVRPSVSG